MNEWAILAVVVVVFALVAGLGLFNRKK